MPKANGLYTTAVPPAELVKKLVEIAPTVGPEAHLTVETNVPGIRLMAASPAGQMQSNDSVTQFLARTKALKHLVVVSAHVAWQNQDNQGVFYTHHEQVLGEIRIRADQKPELLDGMLRSVEKNFSLMTFADAVRKTSPVVDQTAIVMREQSVIDLSNAVAKLAEFQAQLTIDETNRRKTQQKEWETEFRELRTKLESEFLERKLELDRSAKEKDEELAARENEFKLRVAHYDLNEPKAKRREMVERIEKVLKETESLKISDGTSKKRWWNHGVLGLALAASGTIAGFAGYRLFTSDQPGWHFVAPLSGGLLLFAATVVYYLKWNDRWFREHADAEFAAKRYKADILRASWLAELVQEWAKEGKGDLPPELLDAYTRNLFAGVHVTRESEHPLDHLTALMKKATEVEVGKTGFALRTAQKREKGSGK